MKDAEKNLIENLFHRLKKTELNSSERDSLADDLIQNLVKKQPSSSYYMTQTILIQETAIKKMGMKIEELTQRIKELNTEEFNKKPSFLSSFFKQKPVSSEVFSNDNNIWKKKDSISSNHYPNANMSPTTQSSPMANSTSRSNSFLGSALQTATGVAGGMILGNMLMNVFSHIKPEEERFDTVNRSSSDHNIEEDLLSSHSTDHSDLINYEYNESDIDETVLSSDSIDNSIYDTDDIDINDDNFM